MLDPRKLKPAALVRLLNSTPRGAVIGTRQLRRHRLGRLADLRLLPNHHHPFGLSRLSVRHIPLRLIPPQ